MFSGKKVLITGGTGSLGKSLTKKLLRTDASTIRIFSRDEWKQTEMASQFTDNRLRFIIGDVRDKERINRALEGIDIVIHAAALKHVPVVAYNPFEAVKTNITGAQNIIDGCLENNVKVALAVGTDKAVSPLSTYGATKLLMERLFVTANFFKGQKKCKFICARYGNVMGSRGSVIPKFVEQITLKNEIKITDPTMTRFTMTMNEAVDLILRALQYGKGGEIFIPKLKAYQLEHLVEALKKNLNKQPKTKKINIRPGEKYHEVLINKNELRNTFENKKDYVILPDTNLYNYPKKSKMKRVRFTSEYSSDKVKLLTKNQLIDIFKNDFLVKDILNY